MAIRRAFLGCFLAILGIIPCYGASIGVNQFSGLNTQDNPSALQPSQSPDLLNVRLQPGGRSVFKRDGYGLFQTLASSQPIHGGYHFQQTGGAEVQLWGSSTTLYSSVNDATFVAIATGTLNATWQCTDNLGFAYCLTSANDTPVKTDGSLANTTYQPSIPAGTMIASTPLQLLVAGVSGSASTIYISANNNFTNFTTGPLPTDSYTEIVNSPGSRLTHLGYYFGNVYFWKDQSMGYMSGSANQGTVGFTIVSNQIGTLDNSSAFWNPTTYNQGSKFSSGANPVSSGNPYFNEMSSLGGIFFRGQDNHVYEYDGYSLTRLSRIITPNVTSSSRKKANSWTQTTQGDFQAGTIVPTNNLSTSLSPGDVVVSSFQAIENSSTQWTSGSTNNTTVNPSSITLSVNNSGAINNPDFESGSANFTFTGTNPNFSVITGSQGGLVCGSVSPQSASNMAEHTNGSTNAGTATFEAIDASSNVFQSVSMSINNNCTWTQYTLTPTSSNQGARVRFRFHKNDGVGINQYLTTAQSYIWGGAITFYFASGKLTSTSAQYTFYDNVQNGSSTITSGAFTSQIYNTAFTSSTYQLQSSFTVNTSTPSFNLQTSTSVNGPWSILLTSTGTNAVGNQFAKYSSTISISATDNAQTPIASVTIVSKSTGTYYSAVNNAPSLSSFNTFGVDDNSTQSSSITYYTRSSTNNFTVLSSTPVWVSQAKNASVATSTGTFFQMRGDFSVSVATESPTLNDFTFNWFEGSATDKAYINYFQDAIWFSVSSGSSTSTNNTIFYLDLLNNTWLKDDITANGFLVENNALYFGSPVASRIYKFGSVTTDNSNAIHSYWKSMDFTGQDPTVQNSFEQADFAFAESSNTVTFTYDVDQSTSLLKVVSIPLFSARSSILKRGFALVNGEVGTYFNFKVEDNSSLAPWTLMGQRTTYTPLPWRPQLAN